MFTFTLSVLISSIAGDEITEIGYLEGQTLSYIFMMTVLFAPLLETLIFQLAIIEITLFVFNRFSFPKRTSFAIALSSILFGLSHWYNIYYVGFTVLAGISYAVFYLIARSRKDMNGYITATVVHAFSNLFGFIVDDLLQLM
ncbi:CPBP family glutamic-type intramembrane protease [Echinicola rosea]|uniref:CPBP family glutamic-type intramembrane protease n=1 Tax=Echinicola rosea TaxID=1807691 RepID=UPI0016514390|nr:CPBP family glutamic-type intramembrane protease [Echinicola rosea]